MGWWVLIEYRSFDHFLGRYFTVYKTKSSPKVSLTPVDSHTHYHGVGIDGGEGLGRNLGVKGMSDLQKVQRRKPLRKGIRNPP